MKKTDTSPVLTTPPPSRPGYCVGARSQNGTLFRPSDIPGRGVGAVPVRVPSGRIWPNGEFSLGWTPDGEAMDSSYSVYEVPVERPLTDEQRALLEAGNELEVDSPLGLSLPPNQHRPETYGRYGITGYGKKVVRSGVYLLEGKYGKERLTFLTLTVPPMEPDELRTVASSWGAMVGRLTQWLSRRLQQRGLPRSIVSVTECQPRRAEAGDLGCLHLHAVFVGRKGRKGKWAFCPQEIREWWLSELSRRVGRNVHSGAVENLQMVRRSAEGYLGKYMSKGSEASSLLAAKHGWEALPRQWWSCTRNVKAAVARYSCQGRRTGQYLEQLIDWYFKGRADFPGVLMAHHVVIDGTPYLVGFSGRFDKENANSVRCGILGNEIEPWAIV